MSSRLPATACSTPIARGRPAHCSIPTAQRLSRRSQPHQAHHTRRQLPLIVAPALPPLSGLAPAAMAGSAKQAVGVVWASRLAVLAAAAAVLAALPWETVDSSFTWDRSHVDGTGPQDTPQFTRRVISIPSHGELLEAWLYLPKSSSSSSSGPPPVIVLAHGMGAQKDIGLFTYAERFAIDAGTAVLAFDYRTFGGSTGLPRHWVSPRRHLQDWAAVVQHIIDTNLGGSVDGSRIALWGVSYSGGHVLVTAAAFGDAISAVVANEPYVSPTAVLSSTAMRGVGRSLRLLAAGLSDELRRLVAESRLGRALGLPAALPPVYVRLVAPMSDPRALALLPLQDSEMSLRNVAAPPRRQGGWQNKVLARVVLEALGYNPAKHMRRITAPVFFRIASLDHLCPASVVTAAVQRAGFPAGRYVIQERNVTHLEAHASGVQPGELEPVLAFLRTHLRLAAAPGGSDTAGGSDEAAAAAAAGAESGAQRAAQRRAEVQFPG